MNKILRRLSMAVLALMFVWFTCRGILWFYSGDDMMNMYFAYVLNPWRIARAQFMIWMPVYRPLGAAVYRIFYAVFGFHPLPLYIFCWLLLALNAVLSVRFFKAFRLTAAGVIVAAAFALVHGNFQDLYLSAGTMYDRFWFLFTVLGILVYAGSDVERRPRYFTIILLCLLCMDSKESGIALPALLIGYELLFVRPRDWKLRLRRIAPLYIALTAVSLLFVFGRIRHTPELAGNALYAPHADPGLWLTRVAEYWTVLSYSHIPFTALWIAIALAVMLAAALALRDRAMLFGMLFFIVTITPVALIASRPGYVLYVPELGLALYLGALFSRVRLGGQALALLFVLGVLSFHLRNWPLGFTPHNPEYQLSTQMRVLYPTLPRSASLLFVSDNFPPDAWDSTFNLRLMYNDPTITVHRLAARPDQQPDPARPVHYDHVLMQESGTYRELDNRDYKESIRLHLLRDYAPGHELDFTRKDSVAYLLSGVFDGEPGNPTRWTKPHATLKFDLLPCKALFTAKFWVPDFVAKGAQRTLTVLVNGHNIGEYPLQRDGMNEIAMRVEPADITPNQLSIVEMNVSNPYKDAHGIEYGVVLLRAGFVSDSGK